MRHRDFLRQCKYNVLYSCSKHLKQLKLGCLLRCQFMIFSDRLSFQRLMPYSISNTWDGGEKFVQTRATLCSSHTGDVITPRESRAPPAGLHKRRSGRQPSDRSTIERSRGTHAISSRGQQPRNGAAPGGGCGLAPGQREEKERERERRDRGYRPCIRQRRMTPFMCPVRRPLSSSRRSSGTMCIWV